MDEQSAIWNRLVSGPRSERLLGVVMWRVACSLSDMIGQPISNDVPRVEIAPIAQVITHVGDPETKAVGVHLVIESGLRGQAILVLSLNSALKLVDWLMGTPLGTATSLDAVERSALAELGNLMLGYFLNAVAALTRTSKQLRPSPPVVMVDKLSTIRDVIITPMAVARDELLIIETAFKDTEGTVLVHFWVLPDQSTLASKTSPITRHTLRSGDPLCLK